MKTDKEALKQIARQLESIDKVDLTTAELNIVGILIQAGYVKWVYQGDEVFAKVVEE